MRGRGFLELRVISVRVVKDRVFFNISKKRSCVNNRVVTCPRTDPSGTPRRWELAQRCSNVEKGLGVAVR